MKYVWTSLAAISFGLRNSVLVAYSANPTAANSEREPDDQHDAALEQLRRPLQPAEQPEEQRERDVEEHHLLQRLLEVRRVHRLDPVENDEEPEQARDPGAEPHGETASGRRFGLDVRRGVLCERRDDDRERPGRDDEIQRDEQVRRCGSGLDRDAEREARSRRAARAASDGGGSGARAAAMTASPTAAPITASSGWRWTMWSWGECQMSASSRTGASTSAPSIASARDRGWGTSSEAATMIATPTTPSFGSVPVTAANVVTRGDCREGSRQSPPTPILYPLGTCPLRSSRRGVR